MVACWRRVALRWGMDTEAVRGGGGGLELSEAPAALRASCVVGCDVVVARRDTT